MTQDRLYRILVVDDEVEVSKALSKTLERTSDMQSKVSTAQNGKAALEKLENSDFDLVLSDYNMPGMNGVELLTEVKTKHPKAVRMLITGFSDLNIARDAINKAAVHNYIEKPWDNDELRMTIKEALSRKDERESGEVTEVDNVKDALAVITKAQEDIKDMKGLPKLPLLIAFNSLQEFNRFSFMIRDMDNININDVQIFESQYLIKLVVYPKSLQLIR